MEEKDGKWITMEGTNARTNERTNERKNEGTTERKNERTKEGTTERKNVRRNERKNDWKWHRLWALPLTILNHVSLGVDVPVFFHPGDVASSSYFFSLFRYTLNGYLIHNSITNLLVIKALLFDLGNTQSQSSDCAGCCPPLPFYQDRVAVGPTA